MEHLKQTKIDLIVHLLQLPAAQQMQTHYYYIP